MTTDPGVSPTGVSSDRPSDQAVADKTGRSWDGWFKLLDDWDGRVRSHPEIARWLIAEHAVDGWWAQSITVAYERARGLRAPGQGRDGKYTVGASRTVAVPVDALFAAIADRDTRSRWLPGDRVQITTATAPRSVRAKWDGGRSRVVFALEAKGDARSRISVAHELLADPAAAREAKQLWTDRLQALKELLET
ncbi:MAG TPA: hypothetical protein VM754_02395 [Actinomycetota bacterium]|nr:hypothetical protein [Actinomycetota bacterium]